MSTVKITSGGHSVEIVEDGASATALLGVALAAWQATQPTPGQPVGFSAGGVGGIERSPNGTRRVAFRRGPLHITSGQVEATGEQEPVL